MSDEFEAHVKIIAPGRGSLLAALHGCWQYRELLAFLAWRDVKLRYRQTFLGMTWAVLQPVTNMVIFTLIFNRVAGLNAPGGTPYALYTFAALLPWQLFHNSLSRSSESVVAEARLLTKVYFPRLLVPFASVVSGMVDFAISLVILLLLMLYYGLAPGWPIFCLPVFAILAVASALAVGLWLATMNVKYRDFRHAVPFMLSVWMFVTPVAYPAAAITEKLSPVWALVYNLNPMAGVVEGFRWALLGKSGVAPAMMLVSAAAVVVLFVGGLMYFRRMERSFADVL